MAWNSGNEKANEWTQEEQTESVCKRKKERGREGENCDSGNEIMTEILWAFNLIFLWKFSFLCVRLMAFHFICWPAHNGFLWLSLFAVWFYESHQNPLLSTYLCTASKYPAIFFFVFLFISIANDDNLLHQVQSKKKNITFRWFAWLNMKIECKFVHILTQFHFYRIL